MAKLGYQWVGVVGTDLPWPLRSFLDSMLDEKRYGHFLMWKRMFWELDDMKADYHPKDKGPIIDAVADPETVVYMADAHGSHWYAAVYWGEYVYASDIQSAMAARGPMKLALLFRCGAMDRTDDPGTFSYEFRKGQNTGTVVIGITKGEQMSIGQWAIWWYHWLPAFWARVACNETFKRAFNGAQFTCRASGVEDHMVFNGDETLSKKDLA